MKAAVIERQNASRESNPIRSFPAKNRCHLLNSSRTITLDLPAMVFHQVGGHIVGYRCYILDGENHIVQAHDLDCVTDQEARATAASLLAGDPYYPFAEVWHATRRVLKVERDGIYFEQAASPLKCRGSLGPMAV